MTRKSTRVKTKTKLVDWSDGDDFLSETETPDVGVSGKRKRQPTAKPAAKTAPAKRQRRKKRGALEQLNEMPMELLLEIFGQLEPVDLMNLSRASKGLRSLMMSKTTRTIWQHSLSAIPGLPACPEDLNEPQFVCLLFDKACMACGRKVNQVYLWGARFRGCSRCISDSEDRFRKLDDDLNRRMNVFPFLDFVDLIHDATMFVDVPALTALEDEFASLKSETQRSRWTEQKINEYAARAESVYDCEEWERSQIEEKAARIEELKQHRRTLFLRRLRDNGYADVADNWRQDMWKKPAEFIKKLIKKDVTDEAWEGAKDEVLQFAQGLRDERLARENLARQERLRREAITRRIAQNKLFMEFYANLVARHPHNAAVVPAPDLFDCPAAREVFDKFPPEKETEMTLADLESVTPHFEPLSSAWESETKQALFEIAKPHIVEALSLNPTSDLDADKALNLAISWFNCKKCHRKMDSNSVFHHQCSMYYSSYGADPKDRLDLFKRDTHAPAISPKEYIAFHTPLLSLTVEFLRNMNVALDTTKKYLDDLDDIFERVGSAGGRLMVDWRLAIHLPAHDLPKLVKVDSETAAIIRTRMAEDMVERRYRHESRNYYDNRGKTIEHGAKPFACARCSVFRGNGQDIRAHLESEHSVTDPTNDDVVELYGPHELPERQPYYYWNLNPKGHTTYF